MDGGGEDMRALRDVRATLGVGIVLVAVAVALTLTRAPPRVLRVAAQPLEVLTFTTGDGETCQTGEVLPAGASAIRVSLGAYYGTRVGVKAYAGGRVLTEGTRGPDWTSGSVTVPIRSLSYTASDVKLCIAIGPNSEPIYLLGTPTPKRYAAFVPGGSSVGGRVGVEYLAAGNGSWWSRILSVARHMGIGHALGGTWVVLLIAALVGSVGALAMWLAVRELP